MTATVTSFDGSDNAAAIVALDALGFEAGDELIQWKTSGTKVLVMRIRP